MGVCCKALQVDLFGSMWCCALFCVLFEFAHLCSVYTLPYWLSFDCFVSYLFIRTEDVPHQKFAVYRDLIEANDANLLDEEGNSKFLHHA